MKSIIILAGIYTLLLGIKGYGMRGIGGMVGGLVLGFIMSLMVWGGYSEGKKQGVEFSEVQFWVDLVVFGVCAAILFLPR